MPIHRQSIQRRYASLMKDQTNASEIRKMPVVKSQQEAIAVLNKQEQIAKEQAAREVEQQERKIVSLAEAAQHRSRRARQRTTVILERTPKRQTLSTGISVINSNHEEEGNGDAANPSESAEDVERLPRYGEIEPTGYVSDWNNAGWIRTYGGIGYEWDLPYLERMQEYLWTKLRGLVLLPRGHGKTKCVIALIVRYILEVRMPVLVVTSGPTNQRRIFREVQKLLKSEKIRRKYGDVMENFNRTTYEMVFVERIVTGQIDPALKVIGREGDIIGLHPAWIHLEDIVQEEFVSEDSNQMLNEWFDEIISYLAIHKVGGETRITATGTRRSRSDFYAYLQGKNFETLHEHAIDLVKGEWATINDCTMQTQHDANGFEYQIIRDVEIGKSEYTTLGCPNWTVKALLIQRIKNLEKFESQMQNNPLPATGLYFDKKNWRWVDEQPVEYFGEYYVTMDVAYGSSKAADNTAILVGAIREGVLTVVDGIIDKLSPDQMLEWLKVYEKKYDPRIVWVEAVFWQVLLKNSLAKRIKNVTGYKLNTRQSKVMRLDALNPHFIEGRIAIVRGKTFSEKLYIEYMQYDRKPSTATKHDDGLDALAMMMQKLSIYTVTDEPTEKTGQRAPLELFV